MNEKLCCANFYQTDYARLLFGNSMHPGGLGLTKELGNKISITKGSRVLDVACGSGTSAILLAKNFGCHVTGIDLGAKNVDEAIQNAAREGTSDYTEFKTSDAEKIEYQDESFDYVLCECSFCLFPDKKITSNEIYRVTRKGGKIGISDIVLRGELSQNLRDSLYRFVCVLEAKSENEYAGYLQDAGFHRINFDDKKETLLELLDDIKKRVFAAELLLGLKKIQLEIDLDKTKRIIRELRECVESGLLSYVLITGQK
ncbi:MAG: methyltransferase domain-containing protein [Thaumarchaeota archaeon]|nr:methyltransferase domain-containing protein [Nitrososphaerota archaeon]MDE1832139.1 methyltransferase domain-containing protein [Nitrososphaerota archaeon]MDE1841603.1 methyltransferase domain-containing protein [Nitrososphaerota archaeon]